MNLMMMIFHIKMINASRINGNAVVEKVIGGKVDNFWQKEAC